MELTFKGRAILAASVTAAVMTAAQGAVITYGGTANLGGTGFGNTLNVLSLLGTPQESGSVLRVASADVISGNATNQSQTRTVAELTVQGVTASSLGVMFNIAEPGAGTNVTLQGFTVRFTNGTGTLLFDAVYSGSMVLDQVGGGVGGAGHLFNITLTPAEATSLFSASSNRVGMLVSAPILNSAGASENFFLTPSPGAGAMVLVGSLMFTRRRRMV